MPTAFLTGISGFLGSRVAARLLSSGFEVMGLTRLAGPASPVPILTDGAIRLVTGDLLEPSSYRDALHDADVVIHCAAVTGKATAAVHQRVNVDGTAQLVQAASEGGRRPRLVYISTIAVNFRHKTRYPYALAKQRGEAIVRASPLPTTIVRPTIIMGRGAPVLAGLARLARLPVIPVFGNGLARVQPVFVDEVAAVIAWLAKHEPSEDRPVEIGGPEQATIEALLIALGRALGRASPRTIHLPFSIVLRLVAVGEATAFRFMPITQGQLATFRCDGVANTEPPLPPELLPRTGIAEMLQRSLAP